MTPLQALPQVGAQAKVVVLKLSGEALAGDSPPWDGHAFESVGEQIAEIVSSGVRCGIVIGGGNFIRGGMQWGARGLDAHAIDDLGMIGSSWNARALAHQLNRIGGMKPKIIAKAQVAAGLADPWDPEMSLGETADEVIIVAAGVGQSGASTDLAAPILARDLGANWIIMAKYGVEGVFTSDPNRAATANPPARLLRELTVDEALQRGITIMDRKALELCREYKMNVQVVGAKVQRSLVRAVQGEALGSLMRPG